MPEGEEQQQRNSEPNVAPPVAPPVADAPAYDWSKPPQPGQSAYTRPTARPTGTKLVPSGNKAALIAYYCGIFALVPCITVLVLGPVAIYFGFKGLEAYRKDPGVYGKGHSYAGIVLGTGAFVLYVGIFLLIRLMAQTR